MRGRTNSKSSRPRPYGTSAERQFTDRPLCHRLRAIPDRPPGSKPRHQLRPTPRGGKQEMRLGSLLVLILGFTAITGCAFQRFNAAHYNNARQLNPHLLFDRIPGKTFATMVQARSDWPSTVAGRQTRETIQFHERFSDLQGQTRNIENEFRRRFTSHRRGFIER